MVRKAVRDDTDGPNDSEGREAQDRHAGAQAQSPVDKMHVDAPKQRKNARGHAEEGRDR